MSSILFFDPLLAYYFENLLLLLAEDLVLLQDQHFLKQLSLFVKVKTNLLRDLKPINNGLLFPIQLFFSLNLPKDLLILHHIICSVIIVLKLEITFFLRIIWVLTWNVIVRVLQDDYVALEFFFCRVLLLVVLAEVGQWGSHLRQTSFLLLLFFFNTILAIFYLRLILID